MSELSVLAELERNGIVYDYASAEELKVLCPFHNDTSPSCHINVKKKVFSCQTAGCMKSGDFVTWLAAAMKTDRYVIVEELGQRGITLGDKKTIELSTVERYHEAIWSNEFFLNELHTRGVTDALIRQYRLGASRNRITIPITDASRDVVNIRRYLPGASGKDKMKNTRGRGTPPRLWPPEQLEYDKVCVLGGELKAVVAADQLNRHGIGGVGSTAGEGNWPTEFTGHFRGKTVYVIFDVDEAGKASAEKVAQALYRVVEQIYIIHLPLDVEKYPHGDVNDYCGPELNKRLLPLIKKAEPWTPAVIRQDDENIEPIDVELNEATHAKSTGRRLRVKAVACAAGQSSYSIPKTVRVSCTKDQDVCTLCPVWFADTDTLSIPSESDAILEMVAAPKNMQFDVLKEACSVPKKCKVCSFDPVDHYNVEDIRVSPQIEITNRGIERTMQPAYAIGDQIELNETYEMVGRMHPHPKTQTSTLLISRYEPAQDALSCYQPTDLKDLKLFQPEEWTFDGVGAKLRHIYTDFACNVTRIFNRLDIHLAVDLAYHSPLLLPFDGKTVKGWTEILVIGDSSQGKSDTAIGMMDHYGLGEKVECKNATVAGLIGGMQQINGTWYVTWGVIPTHDQRLVIMEELKGVPVETIGRMTDMRSSGIAELPKIEKRRTRARTRLLALSNPRSDRQLATYNFGVDAIRELIGNPEDIRRFDYVLLQPERPWSRGNDVEHIYLDDLCRRLILWAWTRTDKQIAFEPEATAEIMLASDEMSKQFTESIPLIDKGSTRYKLARLAASLAARTFSATGDGTRLLVRKCHVEFIVDMVKRNYTSTFFGYADYTEAQRAKENLLDESILRSEITQAPFPEELRKNLLYTQYIELQDFCDWNAYGRDEAQRMLSTLVRKQALVRSRRYYTKTPAFIEFLKSLVIKPDARPDHIPDGLEGEF